MRAREHQCFQIEIIYILAQAFTLHSVMSSELNSANRQNE